MGSLKDEMRGLTEDHKQCERADDGEYPGSSDGSAEPEGPQINTSQESSTQQSYQPKLHTNTDCGGEEIHRGPISKDEEDSGGVCDNTDQSDSTEVKDFLQTDAISLTQQSEATKDTQNNTTITKKSLTDGEGDDTIQVDKIMCPDEEEEANRIENITIPVPPTPGPCEPCTPAPFGQHHMRTQVSLEVVQCHSAATSPMTPPEGGNSFFFPSSFGRPGAVGADTKDADLQVGKQVEFCSVATSPMTPKTPSTTAFPELTGRETVQRGEERVKQCSVATSPMTPKTPATTAFPELTGRETVQKKKETGKQSKGSEVEGSLSLIKSQAEAESEKTEALELSTSKEQREGFSSNASQVSSSCCPTVVSTDSRGITKDSKQQRMGSMDQDITIVVTHHDHSEEDDEKPESSACPVEKEMIDEREEISGNNDRREDEKENVPTDAHGHAEDDSPSPHKKTAEPAVSACDEVKTHLNCENSGVRDAKVTSEDVKEVSSSKPPVPESPAPFGCHNIRTQVSLEVVQCQSAATSPMTPPEGGQAFCFPSSSLRCGAVGAETKDAELQVGHQVEYRSVATAPMTPRTPVATSFPEVRKETSLEEKIVEEEEEKKEDMEDENKMKEEDTKEESNCNEKSEEPVQEVSWDEKGMTWEVYGAVVEVTVLGSAIQKHLEKQVKKQKHQPSMPPPPPLNLSAMPLNSEGSGKGKRGEQDGEMGRRRRNPFRQLMENMQQPHCCTRAHSAE
ncbi:G protein-regulated inducer of neurite outgrowth 1 [Labrus mixtus]|uniref:G protein-regulated inducer of neurite outgrowth 1 n=1 Tax=Labrus mixtus TaxID=508554 RepID=UPI0029C07A29|nr:G protein-regulated inducer of neurite outgrowth 1 [Labrus mixtus]